MKLLELAPDGQSLAGQIRFVGLAEGGVSAELPRSTQLAKAMIWLSLPKANFWRNVAQKI